MEEFQGNIYVIRNTVFLPSSFGGQGFVLDHGLQGPQRKGKPALFNPLPAKTIRGTHQCLN